MRKHGWLWASESALDAYEHILADSASGNGSFSAGEHLSSFIDLADEVARLEGRIPDSFRVAVDLGTIYSAAAVGNAIDITSSDEFIAKANEAWSIASSHLDNGMLRDAALVEPGPLRARYVGGYVQIPCEINFARYLQTNCTDVSHLRAAKKYWVRAKQERPDHPVLLAVGEHVARNLNPAEQTEVIQYRSPAFLPKFEHSELEPAGQGQRVPLRPEHSDPKPAARRQPAPPKPDHSEPKPAAQRQQAPPKSEHSRPKPTGQRRRGLRISAVVIVMATLTGLAYVYRPVERAGKPQHDAEANSPRSSSDGGISVPLQTTVATPANQPQAIEPGRDKEPAAIARTEEPAETTPTAQEPMKQTQDEKSSRNIAGPQQPAAAFDKSPKATKQNLASIKASKRQAGSRGVEKAADLERQAFQALVAGNYTEAQRLFQASEDAANGFHYSHEWARLLRSRRAELRTIDGRKSVLQHALSKGYASHAPGNIRDKLSHLAQ